MVVDQETERLPMRFSTHSSLSANLFNVNAILAGTVQNRTAMATLAGHGGKMRLITRLHLGTFQPSYLPTTGERNVKFRVNQVLRSIGFGNIEAKAQITQFVGALLTRMGYNTTIEQVVQAIVNGGHKPTSMMPVKNILTDVLGIRFTTTRTDTVQKVVVQEQVKGKGTVNKSRRRPKKTTGKVQYRDPSIASVRTALTRFVYNYETSSYSKTNTVGLTIYGVDSAIDTHDKAFGTRAHFAADCVFVDGQVVVVSVRKNVEISPKSFADSDLHIHDVNLPFTTQLVTLISIGITSTQSFQINFEKMVNKAFSSGANYLNNLWLSRILAINENSSEQIKKAKTQAIEILTTPKITDDQVKTRGRIASSVYDEVRQVVTEQDLQLVGAGATSQQSFVDSLGIGNWNGGQQHVFGRK